MEQLKGDEQITVQDIMMINNFGQKEAWAHILETKRNMELHWNSKLTVLEYCEYYGIEYQTALFYINSYRKSDKNTMLKGAKKCKKVK